MENEKTYLFDVGGVLIDSMPSFIEEIGKYLSERKIKIDSELVKKILPLGYLSIAKYFKELGVESPLYTLVEELKQCVFRAYAFEIKEKKGALTKLLELKARGIRLIAVTTSPHIMSDSALIRLGMYELFDFVFSCDDLGLDKNNPKFYTAVADRCGENPEDLTLFDDNLDSLKAAKESGLTVYGVYDVSSYGDAEKIKEISVAYFKGISELS